VIGDVEAFPLRVPGMPERQEQLHESEAERGAGGRPADRHCNRADLPDELEAQRIVGACMSTEARQCDDGRSDRPRDSPQAMNSEHVEAVVEPQAIL